MERFDRSRMRYLKLSERKNKVVIAESCVDPESDATPVPGALRERARSIAAEILGARARKRSVIIAFGAHAIKNGLGRLLGDFARRGWTSHLATNGAGVIHDWEFAYQGQSSEDVRENVKVGQFGTWQETGLNINLALAVGAYEGLGYGESVGSMIVRQGLAIPTREELRKTIAAPLRRRLGSSAVEEGGGQRPLGAPRGDRPGVGLVCDRAPLRRVQRPGYRL